MDTRSRDFLWQKIQRAYCDARRHVRAGYRIYTHIVSTRLQACDRAHYPVIQIFRLSTVAPKTFRESPINKTGRDGAFYKKHYVSAESLAGRKRRRQRRLFTAIAELREWRQYKWLAGVSPVCSTLAYILTFYLNKKNKKRGARPCFSPAVGSKNREFAALFARGFYRLFRALPLSLFAPLASRCPTTTFIK